MRRASAAVVAPEPTPVQAAIAEEMAERLVIAGMQQGMPLADAKAWADSRAFDAAKRVHDLAELVAEELRETAQRWALERARQPKLN